MSHPLEDYGLIGNMVSAALVHRKGSIDWLCLPHFDSPACFAALLGDEKSGRWNIAPVEEADTTWRYIPGTAVLETTHRTATGKVTVFDFMPLTDDEEKVDVVRIVRGDEGSVQMHTEIIFRFNYGQAVPWVRRRDYGLSAVAGPDAVELHTRVPLKGEALRSTCKFTVHKGSSIPFTLSYHRSHKTPHFVPDHQDSFNMTVSWWHEWSKHCRFPSGGKWRDAVVRSLITLKLLTFQPTGAIVAAPTTSLPEAIGGDRNWDYRYCWLRDSALTLYALLNSGYREEAATWRQWLLRAAAGNPAQLQIMYGITGERWLPEHPIPWLPGYENSSPVRQGNLAVGQVQHDVFGELIDTLHAARAADLAPLNDAWRLQSVLMEHLERSWHDADHGIWEMRTEPRIFTHSRVMCWVAFDRMLKSAESFNLDGPLDKWRAIRDEIHADICAHGYDASLGSFVQYYGSKKLDASLLLIPQVGFLPIEDPRVAGTIHAVERELMNNGLLRRYLPEQVDDNLTPHEGMFLACSFWLADAYVMQGRLEDATELFEHLLSLRNDLGLLSEEYDLERARLVGNFPQAFSHVGLINTAHNLIDAHGPAQQRSERAAHREITQPQ